MMMTVPVLETVRLMLRPLTLADAPAIQARFPRWEIVRLLDDVVPWPYPADGAETYLRDIVLPGMQSGTEWHWSLRRREAPDELIGVIGLRDKKGDNRGFWLDPAWQGRGLMTEAAEVVTAYWFDVLRRPVLQVAKAVENERSRRVSVRAGMRVLEVADRAFVAGRKPAELWEITREEWLRLRG
jgi:ribosomal-protein-alanine N-acetyltransferase